MKKLFAIALSIVMMLSMATTVFAAETIETDGGKADINVNATYQDGVATVNKISVDVSWEAMEFTYSVGGTKNWNEKTHTYTDNTTATWSDGKTITVTNHSDSAIKVEFTFKADTAYDTVTGSFDNEIIDLPSAVGKETTDTTLTGKAKLTLGGSLSGSATASTKVGTVTVKISK